MPRARAKRRPKRNPPVTMFLNPGSAAHLRARTNGQLVSNDALEIWYTHLEDGQLYRHPFAPGVSIEMLADGSARLYRPDKKPLWKNF